MTKWSTITVATCLALTGCAGTKSGTKTATIQDPLFGGHAAAPIPTTPLAVNPAITPSSGNLGTPTGNNQSMAQPTYASPAVLATGAYPALPGGQDLRIGTAPPPQTGNRILPKNQTPPGVSAVVVADPEWGKPRDVPPPPGVVPLDAAGNRTTGPTSASSGLDQVLSQITSMNPRWQKLENMGIEGWRFSCSVPDRNEPNKSRTFEGEGLTAQMAVQAVLDRARQER